MLCKFVNQLQIQTLQTDIFQEYIIKKLGTFENYNTEVKKSNIKTLV